jgi:hypothetical protein
VGEGVLDGDPLAQPGAAVRCGLAPTQLDHTNSFARRIRFTIGCSVGDSWTGGLQAGGRIAAPPR